MSNRARSALRACAVGLALMFAVSVCGAQDSDSGDTSQPRVRVVTNVGSFVIRLDPIRAPLTVERFLALVDSGFYEGIIFHRVIQGFLAQAGAYTKDFDVRTVEGHVPNESGNGLSNLRGTVGYARGNDDPHSGTTQFYINLADNLDLNPRPSRWGYAVFGAVEEGMDVVDEIGHRATSSGGPLDSDVPVNPVIIERIERMSD